MSLRTKIVVIVTLVVVAYAAADHALQRFVILPRFEALERNEASKDMQRVLHALTAEIDGVDERCRQWAQWSETRELLTRTRSPQTAENSAWIEHFAAANLGLDSLRLAGINLLYVVDRDGTVRWGEIRDLDSGARLGVRELAVERLSINHPMLVNRCDERGNEIEPGHVAGLMMIDELGPTFVASRPIAGATSSAPWLGTLITGRVLSRDLVQRLNERTEVAFQTWRLDEALAAEERAVIDQVTSAYEPVVVERNAAVLSVYSTLEDARRMPALLVRADVPRDVSASGATSARYALISTIASGFLLLLVLLFVLRRMVIDPIGRLTTLVVDIGRTENYAAKIELTRDDEVGVLAREFESMMRKLELSRAAVVQAARSAGMSEIATGILHNVGNVLNSVNTSATVITQRVQGSKLAKLERLTELVSSQGERLAEFIATNPKGKHVAPFLSEVTMSMRAEQGEIERELLSLGENIEHIRKLVDSQQALAVRSELREPTDVAAQIEFALSIAARSIGERCTVEVVREFATLERVRVDKHKLVQALVNLFKNAYESIDEARVERGRIVARLTATSDGRVRIEVIDNGMGIAAENLTRVFQHGFTTKSNGHGFGLHSSANSAVEMGGHLSAASDGPGRGATFVLEIPVDSAPVALSESP